MDRGQLERLMILAYTVPDYMGAPVGQFEAFVNPSEITQSYEVEYDAAQGSGTTGSRMDFKKIKPGDTTLAFFLDGTGANGRRIEVAAEIERFRYVTGYSGRIHRPHYLIVAWGKVEITRCVLKSAQIAYKLFHPDGTPLRAVITATFIENTDDRSRVAAAQDQSADLTHVRVLAAGDTLARLCDEIYGDPLMCAQVARANGLDGWRDLAPGTRLVFPPLAA